MVTRRSSRRTRRITILLGGFVGILALIVVLALVRRGVEQRQALQLRDRGMAAYEAGDHTAAVAALDLYTQNNTDDAEALVAAADALMQLPDRDAYATGRAVDLLSRARRVEPRDPLTVDLSLQVARDVLEPTEAVQLVSEVLRANPGRTDALKVRAEKLGRLERFAEAAEDARAFLEQHPEDHEAQMLLLGLRRELGDSREDLVADAAVLQQTYPDDPGFHLVKWAAHSLADQPEEALAELREAAAAPAPSAEFAIELVLQLDRLGRYSEGTDYLATQLPDLTLSPMERQAAAARFFEAARFDDALTLIAEAESPHGLLLDAIVAIARLEGEGPGSEQADAALAVLDAHPRTSGKLWSAVLRAFYTPQRVASEVIKAGNQAIRQGLVHPYLLAMVGEAHAAAADHRTGLKFQAEAARLATAWAVPHIQAARSHLALSQWDQAEVSAIQAQIRRPDLAEPPILRAIAIGSNPQTRRLGKTDEALAYIRDLRERLPREERLLRLHVQALAASGQRAAAREVAESALALDPPPSAKTLAVLAKLSDAFDLGVADQAEQLARGAYGDTPELALRDARALAEAGDVDGGLALLTKTGLPRPQQLQWDLTAAAYLEALDPPAAAEAYTRLSEEHSDSIRVQRQILRSDAARRDRALADQTIERIRTLAGEQSTEWRLERAKWLLAGDDAASQAGRAAELLNAALRTSPNDAEAYLLRAKAAELDGRIDAAVEDAQAAQQIQKDAWETVYELARLQVLAGNFNDAIIQLERVEENPQATPAALLGVARMYADLNESRRAIRLLENLRERGNLPEAEQLALIRLYARSGRTRDAEWQLDRVLRDPSPAALAYAAEFFAGRNQMERATRLLARLESVGADPVESARIRASFAARFQPDEADAMLEAAARATPADPLPRVRLVSFRLYRDQLDAAFDAAREAAQAVADQDAERFRMFLRFEEAIRATAMNAAALPLAATLVESPDAGVRDAAGRALALVQHHHVQGEPVDLLLRGLEGLIQEQPDFEPLRNLTVTELALAGDLAGAEALARQTAAANPRSITPARLATAMAAAQGRWPQALTNGRDWQRRVGRADLPADVAVAKAELQLDQAAEALATLAPHRPLLERDPTLSPSGSYLLAEALVRTGDLEAARDLLSPTLSRGPRWRQNWLRLGALYLTGQEAVDWLAEGARALPRDADVNERFALAEAWWRLSFRLEEPGPTQQRARRLVADLIEAGTSDANTWYFHAVIEETTGGPQAVARAREAYERALELQPDHVNTLNNLAMMIRDEDPARAVGLAEQAVDLRPDDPNLRDTLASAYLAAGRSEEALSAIRGARQLDATNPKWRAREAEVLKAASAS